MKKLLILLCVVATLAAFPSCRKEYTYGEYELIFSTKLISNELVGNEWNFSYYSDEKNLTNGEHRLVLLAEPKTMTIDVTVTEKDKITDIGTGSVSVTFDGETETKTLVTVTERGGPYEGNEAEWEITCKTRLVKMH